MNIVFIPDAWKDYIEWQRQDRKTLERINELIKECSRSTFYEGIGKPEVLRHISGYSRRINKADRFIYSYVEVNGNMNLVIYSCKEHYKKN